MIMVSGNRYGGLSYEHASLFGMPHLGGTYAAKTRTAYERNGTYRGTSDVCVVCGRPACNCHHVVPRSVAKTVRLVTGRGAWVLRSPLFALCGSGTQGCHDGFHGGTRYVARWVWDEERGEEWWWDGTLLDYYEPHGTALFEYGHWEIEDRLFNITRQIRSEI